ncbi:MAG: hypothetical protein FJW79_03755 [Actinobacteria bacterium]|nr:hypothetical protein [Actinomycetota bacterium]
MGHGNGEDDRTGRTLRIAAVIAALIALAAVVAPRLAFSGGRGPEPDPAVPGIPAAASTGTTPVTSMATTTTAGAAATTTTTTTPAPTTTNPPPPPVLSRLPTSPPVDGGRVSLGVAGVQVGRLGPPRTFFAPGDSIRWHFRVTNSGDEYLWGVFVYLERHGPVACASRRLPVGATTDCWAEMVALAEPGDTEVWVTAWTELRMVTDRVLHRLPVDPR